ncbi:MAG: PDZ domain-containing protein [Bacteroidales bacterium]|nr:PDZ domain-containing protein [Bacteroidales bacterium]
MKYLLFAVLCSLFTVMQACSESAYYCHVSPVGNDSCPGTEAQPVATLHKAMDMARNSRKKNAVIVLHQGTHYLRQTITFHPDDPAVRITACAGEKATVSGAALLQIREWQPCGGGIMQTKVGDSLIFDRLFVNGVMQVMARYPDYDSTATHYNGASADAIAPERVQRWSNPAGGFVHALHRYEWGGYHWRIAGKDEQGKLILEGGYQNNRLMGMHDRYRFVENIFEELDTPGEWYFDAETQTLYFYPPEGMDIATACVETPQLEELFVMQGSSASPVTKITIEGITLTHTLRTFMKTREPLLRSDWAICRAGAVRMDGAAHCSVKDCHFLSVGGNAVFFSNYNRENTVSGCLIEDAGASGVCFVGDPKAVRSPLFEYHQSLPLAEIDTLPGPAGDNYPAQCTVFDNLMHDLGRVEKQSAGVQISMSQDITVSHNTIYNLPRAGINISEGTWGGHVIEYNEVFNTVLETGDHGSFNSWGRDRYWYPVRDSVKRVMIRMPSLITADAVHTVIIRHNRFRCDHGWDIDLDDGSSNYYIYNNVCLNGGLKLREGFYRKVENNIILNNSFHPHVWFAGSGDLFRHNIVTAPYFPVRVNDWGTEVDYNLFPNKASLEAARAAGTDAHSVAGDPLFTDAAAGNYRVKADSPALLVGFENFDTDNFGAVSEKLRRMAAKIPLPQLIDLSDAAETGDTQQIFMAMRLKNVETIGERSAAGLSEISGVWVLEVLPESKWQKILQANDVILSINGKKINNVRDLKETFISARKQIKMTVVRNQKEMTVGVANPGL